jgi:hypothetical protein
MQSKHRPIRNTPTHTMWTTFFRIIHEGFMCLYAYVVFNYIKPRLMAHIFILRQF